jgi:hypothetical protein
MQKIMSVLIGLTSVLSLVAPASAASAAPNRVSLQETSKATPANTVAVNSATGTVGQMLKVDASKNVDDMQKLTVTGRGYDLKVGIYVTFCVIPPKGKRPELCGPFDVTGQNNQAVWVSSNPPIYALPLVKPFDKVTSTVKGKKISTGSFKVQVPATRMIGTYDCKVVKCAILTRADHTRSDYRKADVIIPVTFK